MVVFHLISILLHDHGSNKCHKFRIIEGLLVCGMYDTSLGMIENLLQDIQSFGFVPNGGRIYYLDRSQPPMLSEMLMAYIRAITKRDASALSGLTSFLASAYQTIKKEYSFWMNETNGHVVTVKGMRLNQYCSQVPEPRPESYREDYTTAGELNVSQIYIDIRTGNLI